MVWEAVSLDERRRPRRWLWLMGGLAVVVAVGAVAVATRAIGGAGASTVDGAYTLDLSSPRNTYLAGEPIVGITATLTYRGSQSVPIGHAYRSPIGFGILEPVNGITLAPAWLQSCEVSTLDPGIGLTRDFGKSGGSLTSDPAFLAFMRDPVLRLPRGTWHLYAEAMFGEGGCGKADRDIRAEITLDVL